MIRVEGEVNLRRDNHSRAIINVMFNADVSLGFWVNNNLVKSDRAYVLNGDKFEDIATPTFNIPSPIRTVISADFDNDGYDEIFMNNIGEPNKLFKIKENGIFEEIKIENAYEKKGLGTGAAVADIDNDGILELLISHGETGLQPLSLYKADIKKDFKFLRIKPINKFGAPARGATVIVTVIVTRTSIRVLKEAIGEDE